MSYKEITIYAKEGTEPGGADGQGEPSSYLSFKEGKILDISDDIAKKSSDWTIALKRSLVIVNSKKTGSKNILGNVAITAPKLSRDKFLAMKDEDFKAIFESLKSVPEDIVLKEEDIDPVIYNWKELINGKWELVFGKGWKLRLQNGSSFAKLRFKTISEDGNELTLNYAVQKEKDQPIGEDQFVQLKVGESVSILTGKVSQHSLDKDDWDLYFSEKSKEIYMNSGASGDKMTGALGSNQYGAKWNELKDLSDAIVYFRDDYGKIFRSPRWYRYNVDGKHDIHPNGNVYLLKDDNDYYKVQIFDYFEHNGKDVGNFRLRYQKLLR